LPAISPFLSSDEDTTDSDTPDTPPSPTHGTPFTEITAFTQRLPIIPRLAVRHFTDHSSSDSSSEASSYFHLDASSDSSSRHSLSDHSLLDLPSTSAEPSRKRRRSPMTSVPTLSPVSRALSPVRADLIPSPKRIKDSSYLADVEVDHREISLRDDAIVRVSDEPHLEQDSDPEIQAEIDECFAYADALRLRMRHWKIWFRGSMITLRLSQSIVYRLLREFRESRDIGWKMPNTRSGASMTHEEFEELVTRRVAEEMEAREATWTFEPLNENVDEQEGENGGNGNGGNGNGENRGNGNGGNGNGGNGGNGNGNKNGNHGMNYGGF
ncbi:hypothetical protein Tco_1542806, partial [Tanacetum coccineum]